MVTIEDWKPVTGDLPYGNYLITNNINALGAHGDMSHVWHVNSVHKASDPVHGPFTAFHGTNSARVWGVTHYIDLAPVTKKGGQS